MSHFITLHEEWIPSSKWYRSDSELGFLDLILEQLRITHWEPNTMMSLFSSDLRFPLLQIEIVSFGQSSKRLSGSKQNSHFPEKMITDTVDKSTWSTYETSDPPKIRRKCTNGHLSLLRADLAFFFFFLMQNSKWRGQMHQEASKVQPNTNLYLWLLHVERRITCASQSLISFSETIVLVAVLLYSWIKKEKSAQWRCLLWG